MSEELELEAFIDALALRHFRGREFTPYWSRVNANGRNDCPPRHLWPNIVPTLVVLNQVREDLKASITVTSSYRSPSYNRSVGGATASYHLSFRATDVQAKGRTPRQVFKAAARLRGTAFVNPHTRKEFVFRGGLGLYPAFVHMDTRGHDVDF
jgi:hypothetical protein